MKRVFLFSASLIMSLAMAQQTERPAQLDALGFLEGKFTSEPNASSKDQLTAVGQWVLMKQHMRIEVFGTMMGMKMEGLMMLSWDSNAKKYSVSWFDSMGGGLVTSTGDMKGDVLSTLSEPMEMSGQRMRFRTIITKRKDGYNLNVAMGDKDKYEVFLDTNYVRGK